MFSLFDKIQYKVTKQGCWEVTSHKARRAGYPVFRVKGRLISGHRLVYEQEVGKIPKDMLVRHRCDNKECLNPKHLELGTFKDNFEDMKERKGIKHLQRKSKERSESNPVRKLNEEEVREIRKKLEQGFTTTELSNEFGVLPRNIRSIRNRETWDWLK